MPRTGTWSRLWPLLGERRGAITALAVGSLLAGLTESGILALLAQGAAALVDGTSRVSIDVGPLSAMASVPGLLAVAFALALARLALQGLLSALPARIAADVQVELRRELFAAFAGAPWEVQSRDREGHLQEIATDQMGPASASVLQAISLLTALLTFLVLVIAALLLNVLAAALVLAVAVGMSALLRPLGTLGRRRAQTASEASLDYAGGIGEAIRLAEETHAFGVAGAQSARVDHLAGEIQGPLFQTQLLARLAPALYQGLIYLLLVVALAVLYWAGVGNIAILGAVVLILVRAGAYGQQAQGAYQGLRQSLPYLERVQEARSHYEASAARIGTRRLNAVRRLALERVGFEYEPGRPALTELSFEVGAGEAIGIVGPSGAGKSTLVQILLGLRSPSSGRYLVNGVAAERFAREDWHRRFAYMPQQPRLLHASVAENIRFLRDLDDRAVRRAAQLVGIHEEIIGWARGYDTVIGPRADAVSGGQQQRICLARALAGRPEVLVLDEPAAAVDSHAERLISESLAGLRHELTLFVVAHRLSTLELCERAMILIGGRLEAFDAVAQLRTDSAYFRSASALARGAPLLAG